MNLFSEIKNNGEENSSIELNNKTSIIERPTIERPIIKKIKTNDFSENELSVLTQFF